MTYKVVFKKNPFIEVTEEWDATTFIGRDLKPEHKLVSKQRRLTDLGTTCLGVSFVSLFVAGLIISGVYNANKEKNNQQKDENVNKEIEETPLKDNSLDSDVFKKVDDSYYVEKYNLLVINKISNQR